jgi:hypothetical protein
VAAHCWAGKSDYYEALYGFMSPEHAAVYFEDGSTCLLDDGHDGPHEWTPDNAIGITFAEEPADGK